MRARVALLSSNDQIPRCGGWSILMVNGHDTNRRSVEAVANVTSNSTEADICAKTRFVRAMTPLVDSVAQPATQLSPTDYIATPGLVLGS